MAATTGLAADQADRSYRYQADWEEVHAVYLSRHDTTELYTKQVVERCKTALAGANIRHTPITSRIKAWDSAQGSIERRQRARQQAGKAAFRTAAEMIASLPDLGGARISLYFPGDVEKVIGVLQDTFDVVRVHDKPGQNTRRGSASGYRATHVIVKLEASDPGNRPHWREAQDLVVEIQLATIVMHAWSEIENNMIYKPIASQYQEISESAAIKLDLINSHVRVIEVLLRQIEVSVANQLQQRAKEQASYASNRHELVLWIESYYSQRKLVVHGKRWNFLHQLFLILRATRNHQRKVVDALLDLVDRQWAVNPRREDLPNRMLLILTRPSSPLQYGDHSSMRDGLDLAVPRHLLEGSPHIIFRLPQYWGIRLIQSLQMAMYLGVEEDFLGADFAERDGDASADGTPEPPSLVEFLDFMHPTSPRCFSADTPRKITSFCEAFLSRRTSHGLLQVSADLPRLGYTAATATLDNSVVGSIPGLISRILPLYDAEGEMEDLAFVNRVLTSIDVHVGHRPEIARPYQHPRATTTLCAKDRTFKLWDHITGALNGSTHYQSLERQLFVPSHGQTCWKFATGVGPTQILKNPNNLSTEEKEWSLDYLPDFSDSRNHDVVSLAQRLWPDDEGIGFKWAYDAVRRLARVGTIDKAREFLEPGAILQWDTQPITGYETCTALERLRQKFNQRSAKSAQAQAGFLPHLLTRVPKRKHSSFADNVLPGYLRYSFVGSPENDMRGHRSFAEGVEPETGRMYSKKRRKNSGLVTMTIPLKNRMPPTGTQEITNST
ncbi:hypothetical protein F4780DRAFT_395238 [Xylariomycetidae sp. FL0641]|nr:hypothetical protein F4780DRAFT_395238 [Xylariomycetidae sp. FL0641]